MANAILNDVQAFSPYNGGQGVRFTVSGTASTPVGIPGTNNASDPATKVRVRVIVSGPYNACVRFNGTADRNSTTFVPGVPEIFTLPFSPNGVTVSAISENASVTTTIAVVAGDGY